MIIDSTKTYRTKSGHEVRIYALDGKREKPVHGAVNENGWILMSWYQDGHLNDSGHHSESDLVEVDPHGILPRHRELLASLFDELRPSGTQVDYAKEVRNDEIEDQRPTIKVALIALARLESSLRSEVGE